MEEIRSFSWISTPLRMSHRSANKGCNISHAVTLVSASWLCLIYRTFDTHLDYTGSFYTSLCHDPGDTSNQTRPWSVVSQHFGRNCEHSKKIVWPSHFKIYGAVLNLKAKDLLTTQITLRMWQEAGVFQLCFIMFYYDFVSSSLSCCDQYSRLSLFWSREKMQ